jgi:ribosome maturation factor RimP
MRKAVDTERLMLICEEALRTLGLDLVEMEYVRDQHGWVLRVFIDHPPAPTVPRGEGEGPLPVGPSTISP